MRIHQIRWLSMQLGKQLAHKSQVHAHAICLLGTSIVKLRMTDETSTAAQVVHCRMQLTGDLKSIADMLISYPGAVLQDIASRFFEMKELASRWHATAHRV